MVVFSAVGWWGTHRRKPCSANKFRPKTADCMPAQDAARSPPKVPRGQNDSPRALGEGACAALLYPALPRACGSRPTRTSTREPPALPPCPPPAQTGGCGRCPRPGCVGGKRGCRKKDRPPTRKAPLGAQLQLSAGEAAAEGTFPAGRDPERGALTPRPAAKREKEHERLLARGLGCQGTWLGALPAGSARGIGS